MRLNDSRAFALVITLIMVVLAAIIVITFLTSSTSDRTTSKSVFDRYEAELAAQSGLEAAKKALFAIPAAASTPRTQNDDFIVVSVTDPNNVPYYYIASAEDPNNTGSTDYTKPALRYYPLYSGGTLSSPVTINAGAAPPPTPPPLPSPVASQQFGPTTTIYYPKLFSSPAPQSNWQTNIRTQWLPFPSPTPSPSTMQYRYAYWIEDLAGYVDANVAGNTDGAGLTHLRASGLDPKEIALFTLFATPPPSPPDLDPGSTYAKTLVANHTLLPTRLSTRLGTTSGSTDDVACQTSLVANLPTDLEQNVIPFGLGYKNQGQTKTNLNKLISDVAAGKITADKAINSSDANQSSIVKTITDNLPTFGATRQGALAASEGYLETLAANILDYVDTDSTPLVGTNATSSKHYRGIDLMPFVVEVYQMYYWDKGYPLIAGGTVDIRVRTYVQLWNMFNKSISSGTLFFNDIDRAGIQLGAGGQLSSFDAVTPSDSNIKIDFSAKALGPNEYRAVLACERVYTFNVGATQPTNNTIYIGQKGTPAVDFDTNSSYEVQWNGVAYDRPGSLTTKAIEHNKFTLEKLNDLQIIGTMPGLCYNHTAQSAPWVLGDPRASYYIAETQWDRAYVGDSSWGGQVYMKSIVEKSKWVAGESRVAGWADGGHNAVRGVTPTSTPTALTQNPTTLAGIPASEPSKAPAWISNAGRFNSITELSYVYDPFQWDPFGSGTPASAKVVDTTWRDAWKSAFKAASASYGSESTLRIGRPEFKNFDTDAARASRLFDIFSAADPVNNPNQTSSRGKININTASREVLRALGAGIKIGNVNTNDVDQAILPASVYGPNSSVAADSFADAVISTRTTQPFISTSQLGQLKAKDKNGSNSAFFGNPDQWLNNNGPTSETTDNYPTVPTTAGTVDWNDAASEEYFAKIYNLATVRSRNFRVFVTGQYIDPNSNDPYTGQPPRVIATANKVYEVFLKPSRDQATGAIAAQSCIVTYAADLQ